MTGRFIFFMIRLIPAIDIIDGKCVRLTQGDYAQKKIYNENPLEVAQSFEEAGIHFLHLVDLDGAKQKKIINHKVLEQIATHTSLHIDFGGGVQSDEDIRIAFEAGAEKITGGSVAINNPSLFEKWLKQYGADKIILGADVKDEKIAVAGWQESSEIDIISFLRQYKAKGVEQIICTDISKDGLLQGTGVELYKKIKIHFPSLQIIASGGVASIDDIKTLNQMDLEGVIIGKAIYEGRITLKELADFHLT